MSEEYVEFIYKEENEDKMIPVSEVARLYVCLINSFYRVNFENEKELVLN
jgi:hypothetical protein